MVINPKPKERRILEYFQNVWKLKRVEIAWFTLFLSIFTLIWLRERTQYYQASVKLFAHMASKPPAAVNTVELPELERMTFIAAQEELLFSYRLYLKVKEHYPDTDFPASPKKNKKQSRWTQLKRKLDLQQLLLTALFGKSYSRNTAEWSDPDYTEFVKNLGFEQRPASGTFIISYSDPQPERAIKIADTLSKQLVALNFDITHKTKVSLINFVEKRANEAKIAAQKSQKELETFVKTNKFSTNPDILRALVSGLETSREQYNFTVIDLIGKRASIESIHKLIDQTSEELRNEALKGSDYRLNSLKAELSLYQSNEVRNLTNDSASQAYLEQRINNLKKRIEGELKNNVPGSFETTHEILTTLRRKKIEEENTLASMEQQVLAADSLNKKYEKNIGRYPTLQVKFEDLLHKHKENLKASQIFTDNLLSLSIQGDPDVTSLFALEEPNIKNPTSKKGFQMFLGILACIIVVHIGFGFFHFTRGTIFSKDDFYLPGLPTFSFLGSIPFFENLTVGRLSIRFKGDYKVLQAAQAVENLTSNIQDRGRVIQFVSESAQSGGSLSIYALALALRDMEHNVLVIDCDYRFSQSSHLIDYVAAERNRLRIHIAENIRQLLLRINDKDSERQPTPGNDSMLKVTYLKPFESGTDYKSALRYISSTLVKEIEALRKHYTYILIDTTPIYFSDNFVLGNYSDVIVTCWQEGSQTQSQFVKILRHIRSYTEEKSKIATLLTMSRLIENEQIGNEMETRRERTQKKRAEAA